MKKILMIVSLGFLSAYVFGGCPDPVPALDPCDPNPCKEEHKTQCSDDGQGNAVCSCDKDYKDYGDGTCKAPDPCANEATCADQHRECINNQGTAECTECLVGYQEDQGVCVVGELPEISGINGNGAEAIIVDSEGILKNLENREDAKNRFRYAWVIQGKNLQNVTKAELRSQDQQRVFSESDGLRFEQGGNSMSRILLLPQKLFAGVFTLALMGPFGEITAQVYVLQGEKGDPGDAIFECTEDVCTTNKTVNVKGLEVKEHSLDLGSSVRIHALQFNRGNDTPPQIYYHHLDGNEYILSLGDGKTAVWNAEQTIAYTPAETDDQGNVIDPAALYFNIEGTSMACTLLHFEDDIARQGWYFATDGGNNVLDAWYGTTEADRIRALPEDQQKQYHIPTFIIARSNVKEFVLPKYASFEIICF